MLPTLGVPFINIGMNIDKGLLQAGQSLALDKLYSVMYAGYNFKSPKRNKRYQNISEMGIFRTAEMLFLQDDGSKILFVLTLWLITTKTDGIEL